MHRLARNDPSAFGESPVADEEQTVTPPGGPRPASQVHQVAPGETVLRAGAQHQVVQSSGTLDPSDIVVTPGGARARSLVHEIAAGAVVDGSGGLHRMLEPSGKVLADFGRIELKATAVPLMPLNVVHPAPKAPAFGSGWITNTGWTNTTGTPVSFFSTTWVVPPAPSTQSGQLLYLFNGIQNSTMIYQPVLQWGNNGSFGGNYWCVASWYADGQGGPAFHSTPVNVNVGDTLVGIMTLTGQGPQGFSYDCVFQGIGNSDLKITNVQELTWCVETLECYYITQCSDYPNTDKTAMRAIEIRTGTTHPSITWTVSDIVTDCGQHTLVFDEDATGHGEVDLWYHGSPFWTAGFGTISPGTSQDWWFAWGGNGDVGPQLIQAEPLASSGELVTTQIAESRDGNGFTAYHAIVRNDGPNPVAFQWRGGGR
jgi:hypothetical protein